LNCRSNQLSSIDLSQNIALTYLNCYGNQLTSLNISQNTALTYLDCYFNQLTNLDATQNTALTNLNCYSNQLTSLDVRNGNNTNMNVRSNDNLQLYCINVDNIAWSTANWTDIDPQHYFSDNCPPPSSIQEHTTNKELLKVKDLLGRETKLKTSKPLFYIYDDGTVEKRIVID
jgi:Leucine-rich repeat (LRR) protein